MQNENDSGQHSHMQSPNGNRPQGSSSKWIVISIACVAAGLIVVAIVLGMRFMMFRNTISDLIQGRLENTGIISRFMPGGVNEDLGESIRDAIDEATENRGGLGERFREAFSGGISGNVNRAEENALRRYVEREGGSAYDIENMLRSAASGYELSGTYMQAFGNNMVIYFTVQPANGEYATVEDGSFDDFTKSMEAAEAQRVMADISAVIRQDVQQKTGYTPSVRMDFFSGNNQWVYSFGDGA